MRRLSIIVLSLSLLAAVPVSLLAEESTHSCTKTEKSCCMEKADCCKTAKSCCDDAKCCTTAADGTHACTMKHADGTACTGSSCCKDKSCATKKTS